MTAYQGKITVPFSPESILSGVEKIVMPDEVLWYHRTFSFHKTGDRVLLHFGAADYSCSVILNDREIGTHKGGYLPFTFDITDSVRDGENNLQLRVVDPTDEGSQARGKQRFQRGEIWYTPQSGIWQTVWLEEVCSLYIKDIRLKPDIDRGVLLADICGDFTENVEVTVLDEGNVKTTVMLPARKGEIPMEEFHLWCPEDPHLYDLEIRAGEDLVESYFAMRKFSTGKDSYGISRIMLNNKPYFMNGRLAQGYWSDGMYTAPSGEALIYDIQTMKDLGFNTLRKHIKIEPLRWYYHCDRLGMIVWQDIISGGGKYNRYAIDVFSITAMRLKSKHLFMVRDWEKHRKFYARQDPEGIQEFYLDSENRIALLYNTPSIALWPPMNEAWGQFDCLKVCDFYRKKDTIRLIDHASGWVDHGGGDINSFHIYHTDFKFYKFDKNDDRPLGLTEYGGYSIPMDGHVFNKEKEFGYQAYKNSQDYNSAIGRLLREKICSAMHNQGLSAAIYTEVSDVEDELNGFLTYGREVLKVDPAIIREANAELKL